MEFLSTFSGADNLRKLAVQIGLLLMAFGVLYPLQKNLELKEKKIKFSEAKSVDSIEVIGIKKEVDLNKTIIYASSKKVKSLSAKRDSLMNTPLTEATKFKILLLDAEINRLNEKDEAALKKNKEQLNAIEASLFKSQSLKQEINNLNEFIGHYNMFMITSFIIGIIMFFIGLIKWRKSQRESDDLVFTELQIKKEELKKIKHENSNIPS